MAMVKKTDTEVGTGRDGNIKIRVRTQGGREVCFRMNRTTRLERLFRTFCTKLELEYGSVQFLYNGYRVLGNQSPEELKMEEGEDMVEIEAMMHQMGGCLLQYEG